MRMPTTHYTTLHIDRSSPDLVQLADKFRAVRLYALTHSPSAFSSTYAIESAWPLEFWVQRLARPGAEYFVVIAHSPEGEDEWVGQATLIGPLSEAVYALPPEAKQPIVGDETEETRWQMTAVYLSDQHRGKGLAKLLCQAAFDFAAKFDEAKTVRLRIMIHPDNLVVKKLYSGMGFFDAGGVTLAEAYKSNGDAFLIPEDGGGKHFNTRVGLIMVKVM